MNQTTSLYNILIDFAFLASESEYANINEMLFSLSSEQLIIRGCSQLFNFYFPTPDSFAKEDFLKTFYVMFSGEYIESNIASETAETFKIKVMSKTLQIMPYYSKVIDILINSNIENLTEKRELTRNRNANNSNDSSSSSTANSNALTKAYNSQFPDKLLSLEEGSQDKTYIADGSRTKSETGSNVNANANSSQTTNEDESVLEKSGNFLHYVSELSELKNIFKNMISEYADLFSLIF